jgi:hypothetical protein
MICCSAVYKTNLLYAPPILSFRLAEKKERAAASDEARFAPLPRLL